MCEFGKAFWQEDSGRSALRWQQLVLESLSIA